MPQVMSQYSEELILLDIRNLNLPGLCSIEYILTEILKNSYRATVEHHHKQGKRSMSNLPPVTVTIAPPTTPSVTTLENSEPPSSIGQTISPPSYLSIRVRDEGGGVPPTNLSRIFSYAFTTAGRLAQTGEDEGGPYAAQHIGGAAAMGGGSGAGAGNVFGEIAGRGLQTGMGTIAGLGYGSVGQIQPRLETNYCRIACRCLSYTPSTLVGTYN